MPSDRGSISEFAQNRAEAAVPQHASPGAEKLTVQTRTAAAGPAVPLPAFPVEVLASDLAQPRPWVVPVQRAFTEKSADSSRVVPPEDVGKLLTTASQEFFSAAKLNNQEVVALAKKLAEGPAIVFTDLPSLERAILRRLEQFPQLSRPKVPARRLNRLAGQLETKLSMFASAPEFRSQGGLLDALHNLQSLLVEWRTSAMPIVKACNDILEGFLRSIEEMGPRGMWLCYDVVSSFGPLGHALLAEKKFPEIEPLHSRNLVLLRSIRQSMARREGISVIAHRGSGPTSRTMGGLIQKGDQRRLNRPAENSPEAFEAALRETRLAGLDGIECDVFLSRDRVPMLTHEGNVAEQLNEVHEGVGQHAHVHEMTAEELTKITRTSKPASRFMTLAELLQQVAPYAQPFYEATGRPLRVEIEMKGTKHDDEFDPMLRSSPLLVAVARVVSQAVKASPGLPVEYVLFNNEAADVARFSEVRGRKTALGGLYTGEGGRQEKWAKEPPDPRKVDEVRYQFTDELPKNDIEKLATSQGGRLPRATDWLNEYIVTLVYGQEFAPRKHPEYGSVLKGQEPSQEVVFEGRRRPSDDVVSGKGRRYDDAVLKVLKRYARAGGRTDKLHILTDYPKKAAFLKEKIRQGPGQEVRGVGGRATEGVEGSGGSSSGSKIAGAPAKASVMPPLLEAKKGNEETKEAANPARRSGAAQGHVKSQGGGRGRVPEYYVGKVVDMRYPLGAYVSVREFGDVFLSHQLAVALDCRVGDSVAVQIAKGERGYYATDAQWPT